MLYFPYFSDKLHLLTMPITTWLPWKFQFQPGFGTRDLFNIYLGDACQEEKKQEIQVAPTVIPDVFPSAILLNLPNNTMTQNVQPHCIVKTT